MIRNRLRRSFRTARAVDDRRFGRHVCDRCADGRRRRYVCRRAGQCQAVPAALGLSLASTPILIKLGVPIRLLAHVEIASMMGYALWLAAATGGTDTGAGGTRRAACSG